jgi:hypothetical protein
MVQIIGKVQQLGVGEEEEKGNDSSAIVFSQDDAYEAQDDADPGKVHPVPGQRLYPFEPIVMEKEAGADIQQLYPAFGKKA